MSSTQKQRNIVKNNNGIERFSFKAVNANYPMRRDPADVWGSLEGRKTKNTESDSRKQLAFAFGLIHVAAAIASLYYISSQFIGF